MIARIVSVRLVDSQGTGQGTDWKTSLLLVEIILMTGAGEGLLLTWLGREQSVV